MLSSLVFAVAATAAVGQLALSDRIARSNGCGFDGFYYCAMVRGEIVSEPFNRRVLLAFLVGKVDADGLAGFWAVSIASLVAATAIAMMVAWRLRVATRLLVFVSPLVVGAAFLLARNTFHLTATYPALSDALGLVLLMAAVALVVLPMDPSTRLLLVPVAFLAPLAREQLAVVLPLGFLLAARLRLLSWPFALGSTAATVAGGVLAFTRPSAGTGFCLTPEQTYVACPDTVGGTLRFWLKWDFGSSGGLLRFLVMVALGLGSFLLALGILRFSGPNAGRARWIAAVATLFAVVSVFGGGDTDRVLMPAGLLLVLAVAIGVGRNPVALLALAILVTAYAIQQEPFAAVGGSDHAWLEFFGLRTTTTDAVIRHGLVPTLVALPVAVAGFVVLRRAGASRSRGEALEPRES